MRNTGLLGAAMMAGVVGTGLIRHDESRARNIAEGKARYLAWLKEQESLDLPIIQAAEAKRARKNAKRAKKD